MLERQFFSHITKVLWSHVSRFSELTNLIFTLQVLHDDSDVAQAPKLGWEGVKSGKPP
jgi:hypothetical protein